MKNASDESVSEKTRLKNLFMHTLYIVSKLESKQNAIAQCDYS